MNIKNFVLTQDLYLPRQESADYGSIYFEKDTFGLGYENYRPFPASKTLNVDLVVRRVSDSQTVFQVKTYNVTENGTPTGLYSNQADIDKFNADKLSKQKELDGLRQDLLDLNADIAQDELDLATTQDPEAQEIIRTRLEQERAERDTLNMTIRNKEQVLWAMVPPTPVSINILPYSEVVAWFNNEGILLEEYYEDALNIPFLDGVVGDYVKA